MRRQLRPALLVFAVFTLLCGIAYPLAVTGVAQALWPDTANGSIVRDDAGTAVGSRLIGQAFEEPANFHTRPSAAGDGYDSLSSGGSNLGPTNPELAESVDALAAEYRDLNGLAPGVEVPVDAVTASASGLDPHISPANAALQVPRVARERGLDAGRVMALIAEHTEGPTFGFLGEAGVNVLELNMALDAQD